MTPPAMHISEQRSSIGDYSLHQLTLSPHNPVRGSLIFFHGQGDYIDRYPSILAPFVQAGYQCILTDLPGHGRSPGPRGHIPSIAFVRELFNATLAPLSGPLMIAGHSMGGLLALHFFLESPARFSAAWFSSPLLDPMQQAQPWMRTLLPLIAPILPSLTVSTGVRSEDCGDDPSRNATNTKNPSTSTLYHNRISLAWGRTLRDTAAALKDSFPTFPPQIPTLITQGTADPVCPASLLRDRLDKLPQTKITYQEIPAARHEPFTGSTAEAFQSHLQQWISQHLLT